MRCSVAKAIVGVCVVGLAGAAGAQNIDDYDDFFSTSVLDASWTPDIGTNGTYSLVARPGYLRVTVPGSVTQTGGEVSSFLRLGPDHATFPEWWAVVRFEHNIVKVSNNGAAGMYLAGGNGTLSPTRVANNGSDGVFVFNSGKAVDGTPKAMSNPILLLLHKRTDGMMEVWFKDDASANWVAMWDNLFDLSAVDGGLSPFVNLIVDAREAIIGSATGDLVVDFDYINFSTTEPVGIGIDYLDDFFDTTTLDPGWVPIGTGAYSTTARAGFLRVNLLGSLTQFPGQYFYFDRLGPPSTIFPRWFADLRLEHTITAGPPLSSGAAGVWLRNLSDWKLPARLANIGADGVFVFNGPAFNEDTSVEAASNPITLRIEKNEFNELLVHFKSDGATDFTPMVTNPFDAALIFGPAGHVVSPFFDARFFTVNGAGDTDDQVIDLDFVDFSVPGDGDCNGDGDVDLGDYAEFQACFSGGGGGVLPGCDCADVDRDGDVDLTDYGIVAGAMSGPS